MTTDVKTTATEIRRFNEAGLKRMQEVILSAYGNKDDEHKRNLSQVLPFEATNIALDDELTEIVVGTRKIELDNLPKCKTHFEMVQFLINAFYSKKNLMTYLDDDGVIAWLTMALLPIITKQNDEGYILGEQSRYILNTHRHDRHLVRTPLALWLYYGEDADFLVKSNTPDKLPDAIERFMFSENIRRFRGAVALGNKVFHYISRPDVQMGSVNEMASTLARVISQFMLKWDIEDMNAYELAELLYREPKLRSVLDGVYPSLADKYAKSQYIAA